MEIAFLAGISVFNAIESVFINGPCVWNVLLEYTAHKDRVV